MELKIPRPKMKVLLTVINPKECTQCGRTFKPARADDDECPECTEALNDEG